MADLVIKCPEDPSGRTRGYVECNPIAEKVAILNRRDRQKGGEKRETMLRSVTVLRTSSHTHARAPSHQRIIRTAASTTSRQLHYVRHTPLSVRAAIRPSTRGSHHPTNLPQIFPRRPSPAGSRRNSTVSNNHSNQQQQQPSRRMRFVRRFVETVSPVPQPNQRP